jgi:hypothetical protein
MALGAYREKDINSMAGREGLIDYLTRCRTQIRDAIEQLQATPEGERDSAGTMLLLPQLSPVELTDALREASGSNVGSIAYTVPYAISNILLTVWGPVVVAIVHAMRS